MKRTIRLTESELRGMISEAIKKALQPTRTRRPMNENRNKTIRLTESELRGMIQEAVNEALIEEGFFNDTKVGRGIRNGLVGGAMALGSLAGTNCSGNNTSNYQDSNQTTQTQNVEKECEQLRIQVDKNAKNSLLNDDHFAAVYNACGGAHCYSVDLTRNPNAVKMAYEAILNDMNNGIQFYRVHLGNTRHVVNYVPADVVQSVLGYATY